MTISEKIFKIMNEKNMTQKEFSKITRIPESTISDWKKKGNTPSSDKLLSISVALNVTVYDLLSDEPIEGADSSYYVIDSKSQEGVLIETMRSMDKATTGRILGYAQALKDLKN